MFIAVAILSCVKYFASDNEDILEAFYTAEIGVVIVFFSFFFL